MLEYSYKEATIVYVGQTKQLAIRALIDLLRLQVMTVYHHLSHVIIKVYRLKQVPSNIDMMVRFLNHGNSVFGVISYYHVDHLLDCVNISLLGHVDKLVFVFRESIILRRYILQVHKPVHGMPVLPHHRPIVKEHLLIQYNVLELRRYIRDHTFA